MRKKILPKKYIYRIILINHGKEVKELYKAYTERDIYGKYNELKKESESVVLPIRYNNNKTEIIESAYEIAIIKVREKGELKTVKIRDDSGKFINYKASNTEWVILDRASYNIEETFFVYGHHPRYDRKDYSWIFDELFLKENNNGNLRMCALYQNKVLIENGKTLDIVLCKNKNEGVRLFNKMEELSKSHKIKNMLFIGDIARSRYKSEWIDKIMKATGWSRHKVKRNSTRP